MTEKRSTQQVVDDHLRLAMEGELEQDLARNYAQDVVVLSNWGVEHGHDGARRLAQLLQAQLPDSTFAYRLRMVERDVAMLQWTAESAAASVHDGVDSFVVRDGRITAQTIWYSLTPPG